VITTTVASTQASKGAINLLKKPRFCESGIGCQKRLIAKVLNTNNMVGLKINAVFLRSIIFTRFLQALVASYD
jgi:hypothetical protein